MRLAHLADLHVGFRQYDRLAPGTGTNQRERDVAVALHAALDGVIAATPDAVLIAGDVFHSVRPPNSALLTLFSELGRLRAALPIARICVVAGNHDTPRSSDAGTILPLFKALGVDVATSAPVQWRFEGLTVTGVPSAAVEHIPPPDPNAQHNVLLIHGDVPGYGAPKGLAPAQALSPAAFERWDYVALGHYHSVAEVTPRAWYSGALEFTSTDPWSEIGKPKGWLLVELSTGQPPVVTFQPIETPRRFVDVDPIDATGLASAAVDALITERLTAAQIDGAVVRLVVTGVSREVGRALDHAALRSFKGRALNLHLRLERPEHQQASLAARQAVFRKLDAIVADYLGARELPPDLDRAEFVRLGLEHFAGKGGPA